MPVGLVRPEIWSKHLAAHLPSVAEPFAEVISKCKDPFVTKVNDALSEKASFYDGHVVLVGDALCTVRPHLAAATEQAAGHCLSLGKVWIVWGREQLRGVGVVKGKMKVVMEGEGGGGEKKKMKLKITTDKRQ